MGIKAGTLSRHVDDAGSDNDDGNDAAGACPLQSITCHNGDLQAGPLLLTSAVYAITSEECVRKLLKGSPVAKKAITHIWDSIARVRREHQWGTLHKQCPCVYIHRYQCLVLFDAEGREIQLVDKN